MADPLLAITTEYVQCFFALMGKGVWWPKATRRQLVEQDLSWLDVTYVITHGDVIEAEKETADGTTVTIIGYTCDDERLRIKFWADPNQLSLRILDVSRL
jgi:hypothetical protein